MRLLRRVRLEEIIGRVFVLTTWATGTYDRRGRECVAYELRELEDDCVIFSGDDYVPSPLVGLDSDESLRDLLAFFLDEEEENVCRLRQLKFLRRDADALRVLLSDDEISFEEFSHVQEEKTDLLLS